MKNLLNKISIVFNLLSPIIIGVSMVYVLLRKFKEPVVQVDDSQYLMDCLPWFVVIFVCVVVMILTVKEK